MDKEEAMKILKDFHDKSALFSVRTALDTIIPELKVSEDEEVRKIILDQMKCWNEDAIQKNCEIDIEASSKCIAWLEKQGEHANFLNKIQVGDKVTRNEFGVLVNLSQLKRVAKPADKQGEKPRYSIGDILCDKSCTTLNKDTQPNFEIIDIRDGMYICDNGSLPISQQDEYELVAKKIEQKPQRMISAEAKEALYDKPTDEEMKELLRTEYEKGRADTIAEMEKDWSEEDEENRNLINTILWESVGKHLDAPEYDSTVTQGDAANLTQWLKSLKGRVQPQPKQEWKPSDEQMDAVKSAALDVVKFSLRSEQLRLENEPYYKALVSLYNDLEKLREE